VVWDTPHLPRLKWPSRRPLSLPQARITRAMLGGGLAYETPNICLPVEYRSSLTDTPQICGRWSPSNHADGFPVTSAPICPGDSAAAQHVHQRCARRGPPVPVRRGCPPRLGRRSPGRCSGFKSPPPSVPMCPRGCCQGRQEDLNFPNLPPPPVPPGSGALPLPPTARARSRNRLRPQVRTAHREGPGHRHPRGAWTPPSLGLGFLRLRLQTFSTPEGATISAISRQPRRGPRAWVEGLPLTTLTAPIPVASAAPPSSPPQVPRTEDTFWDWCAAPVATRWFAYSNTRARPGGADPPPFTLAPAVVLISQTPGSMRCHPPPPSLAIVPPSRDGPAPVYFSHNVRADYLMTRGDKAVVAPYIPADWRPAAAVGSLVCG